jgi:hypothetical protein
MYDIPFDRSFLQLSNGIRHVMPSTDPKPELTANSSMAQPVSQPAVYANGLTFKRISVLAKIKHTRVFRDITSFPLVNNYRHFEKYVY